MRMRALWHVLVGPPVRARDVSRGQITPVEGLSALSLDALTSVAYGRETIIAVLDRQCSVHRATAAQDGSGALPILLAKVPACLGCELLRLARNVPELSSVLHLSRCPVERRQLSAQNLRPASLAGSATGTGASCVRPPSRSQRSGTALPGCPTGAGSRSSSPRPTRSSRPLQTRSCRSRPQPRNITQSLLAAASGPGKQSRASTRWFRPGLRLAGEPVRSVDVRRQR